MRTYAVGQEIRLAGTFKNLEGNLADGTVTIKIRACDGTQYEAPAAHDSTGQYHGTHVVQAAEAGGTSKYRVASSAGVIAADWKEYKVKAEPFT
jgi:hypothetical protein